MKYLFSSLSTLLLLLVVAKKMWAATKTCTSPVCVMTSASLLASMDQSADPCDDFNQFACGGYLQKEEYTPGSVMVSPLSSLNLFVKKPLIKLLDKQSAIKASTNAANHSEPRDDGAMSKFLRFYSACTNVEAINRAAQAKADQIVDEMGGFVTSLNGTISSSFEEALEALQIRYDKALFFDIGSKFVEPTFQLEISTLILPTVIEESYILSGDINILVMLWNIVRIKGKAMTMQRLVEVAEFAKKVKSVLMGTYVANDENPGEVADESTVTLAELQRKYAFLNWTHYFEAVLNGSGISLEKAVVDRNISVDSLRQLGAVSRLCGSYFTTPIGQRTVHNFLVFASIENVITLVGTNNFHSPSPVRIAQQRDYLSSRHCVPDFGFQGHVISSIFVKNYVARGEKEMAIKLADSVIEAFRLRLEEATWMDNETKSNAIDKIDAMQAIVGYSDELLNDTYLNEFFTTLVITDDHVQNMVNIAEFIRLFVIQRISSLPLANKPQKHYSPPQLANAAYDPFENTVLIPSAILQPPFYYPLSAVPAALTFGSLAFIIGHEITHGFDNKGRHRDRNGNLKNWWSAQSDEAFNARLPCFIDQYNSLQYNSPGGTKFKVNGNRTLAENIADNGGIKVAYDAFKSWLASNSSFDSGKLVGFENFTDDQVFFLSRGASFCKIYPSKSIPFMLADEHAPSEARTNAGLANFPAFAAAFNCPLGSRMNPKNKCSVW